LILRKRSKLNSLQKIINSREVKWRKNILLVLRDHFLFFILFVLMSCAHVVSPVGGLKDTQPPNVFSCTPANFSTHFKSNQAILQFDEYIDLKNLNDQLVISPFVDVQPEIKVKRKSIQIDLSKTSIHDSTTYTFNFGNAIVDVNENNILNNFRYVFSTGSYLDSMRISGRVIDYKSLQPVKDALVLLYHKKNGDSLPYKTRPDYFTKTSEDGKFELKNIPSGPKKIFALKDGNADFLYNQPGEAIAFSDSLVDPNLHQEVEMKMFTEEISGQYVLKASSPEFGRYVLVFKRSAMSMDISALSASQEKKPWDIKEYSPNKDTVILWNTIKNKDTLFVKLHDRLGLMRDTTLPIPVFVQSIGGRQNKKSNQKLKIGVVSSSASKQAYFAPLMIESVHPLVSFDANKIVCMEDSVPLKDFQLSYMDSIRRKLLFNYKWKQNANYQIKFLPSAFTDIFGHWNDTVNVKIKTSFLEEYGLLNLKMNLDSVKKTQYIISIVNEKDVEVWHQVLTESGHFVIDHLEPGKYKLRAIEDVNANGQLDTGNYHEKRQPEKVLIYPEAIQIRSNWDVDAKWTLKF